jgi:hypothetical protein
VPEARHVGVERLYQPGLAVLAFDRLAHHAQGGAALVWAGHPEALAVDVERTVRSVPGDPVLVVLRKIRVRQQRQRPIHGSLHLAVGFNFDAFAFGHRDGRAADHHARFATIDQHAREVAIQPDRVVAVGRELK